MPRGDERTRILIVDDDPDSLEIVSTFLDARGYDVATASRGEEALDAMEAEPPALVLLDVMMPGMDGWEVARMIRDRREFDEVRVVMLSARGGSMDTHQGMRAGADDYIAKPVRLDELASRIERNLEPREP